MKYSENLLEYLACVFEDSFPYQSLLLSTTILNDKATMFILSLVCLFISFCTTALQESSVKLTWDETDPKRVKAMMRK